MSRTERLDLMSLGFSLSCGVNKHLHRLAPGRAPDLVPLTYFRSQEEYDAFGRDAGPFGVANANSRAVADALMARGIEVEFRYPDEGAVRTPGSRY